MTAELRRAARARASSTRDPRIAEVLRRCVVHARERAGDAWESSDGTVRAVDLHVEVDGYALGLCETYPAVRDAVVEALTAEAPRVLGASVVDLAIEWGIRERAAESGYRDGPPEPLDREDGDDVRRALIGFLRASGESDIARALASAEIEVGARGVDVLGIAVDPMPLVAALRVLYQRPMGARVRR